MFRNIFLAAALVAASVSAAYSQSNTWYVEGEPGFRGALYDQPDIAIVINCIAPGNGVANSVDVVFGFGPDAPVAEGTVIVSVDGRAEFELDFDNGLFEANTPAKADTFRALTAALKTGNRATVASSTNVAQISLRGSSRAIGDCEPPADSIVAEATGTSPGLPANPILAAEEYLAALGYNPGPLDGVVDNQTQAAAMEWKSENGLPATPGLSPEEFTLLQAQATGPTEDTSSTTPASTAPLATTIMDCGGLFGAGIILYDEGGYAASIPDMSDFCLDEVSGTLASAETLTGLVKTQDAAGSRTYESTTGPQTFTVSNLGSLGICDRFHDDFAEFSVYWGNSPATKRPGLTVSRGAGYVVDGSQIPGGSAAFPEVRVTFVPLGIDGSRQPLGDLGLGVGLSIKTALTFAGGLAATDVIAPGYSANTQAEAGQVSASLGENGRVNITGEIRAQSNRLANFSTGEWRSITLPLGELNGYVTAGGKRFLATGPVTGRVMLEGQGERSIQGYASVLGCR